jgi:hypothetical protein
MSKLFRVSQKQGIYRTQALWSRLSPHLSGSQEPEPTITDGQKEKPEARAEEVIPIVPDSNDWPDSF